MAARLHLATRFRTLVPLPPPATIIPRRPFSSLYPLRSPGTPKATPLFEGASAIAAETTGFGGGSLANEANDLGAGPSAERQTHESVELASGQGTGVQTFKKLPRVSAVEGLHYGPNILHVPLTPFSLDPSASMDGPPSYVPLSAHVFGLPPRPDILHQCVKFERSLMRSGSANTKTRSELAYSGRKLRPQKGTGRARQGSRSSPLLRGGATMFGPKPTDHSQGLNRKTWELGLRLALSERWRSGDLIVVPAFDMHHLRAASEVLDESIGYEGGAWDDAVYIAGGGWGRSLELPGAEPENGDLLREALERRHLIRPGIRLGQSGPLWERMERERILPRLNTIDLAHPSDFGPGKPHPTDWKPGKIGCFHLLMRKRVVMDLAGLTEMQHRLTADLRRPIGAIGTDRGEWRAWQELSRQTMAARIEG